MPADFRRERLKAFSRLISKLYEKDSTCSAKRGETLLLLRSNEKISLSPGRDYRLRESLSRVISVIIVIITTTGKKSSFVFNVKSLHELRVIYI